MVLHLAAVVTVNALCARLDEGTPSHLERPLVLPRRVGQRVEARVAAQGSRLRQLLQQSLLLQASLLHGSSSTPTPTLTRWKCA